VRALYEAPSSLLTFPNRRRPGKKEGTCELVMSPLPYIVVYTVRGDAVYVVRILTGRSNGREGTRTPVVQPGARRHGEGGIHGMCGIVESVTYRF
jgi:hypothetical protein